jgi:hypothetical protein
MGKMSKILPLPRGQENKFRQRKEMDLKKKKKKEDPRTSDVQFT